MNVRSLVNYLVEQQAVMSDPLKAAFAAIDRRDFVLPLFREEAYGDYPLPIGHGQTISQPAVVALMLELLQVRPGQTVMDVGSGTGYTSLLLAELVGPKGHVYGVEVVPEVLAMGKANLAKYANYTWVTTEPAGSQLGLPERAPFDRILVSAAAPAVPTELLDQLSLGGILVMPIGQSIFKIIRTREGVQSLEFPGFAFVALRQTA